MTPRTRLGPRFEVRERVGVGGPAGGMRHLDPVAGGAELGGVVAQGAALRVGLETYAVLVRPIIRMAPGRRDGGEAVA
ncbi:MAG TPA: hypothetical protein ENH00_06285 [Actinobacteria bacterium]|nr:hypothetical protein [Actinomycetota bacterium]